jgi:hypothetical protein
LVLASLSQWFGNSSIAFFHLLRLEGRRCRPRMHGLNQPHRSQSGLRTAQGPGLVVLSLGKCGCTRKQASYSEWDQALMLYCIGNTAFDMWVFIGGGRASCQAMLIFELDGSRVIIGAVASHSSGCPVFEKKTPPSCRSGQA